MNQGCDHLRDKLVMAIVHHENMLKVNNLLRRKNIDMVTLTKLLGGDEEEVKKRLTPNFAGRIGFKDYELLKNRAEIKRLQCQTNDMRNRKKK